MSDGLKHRHGQRARECLVSLALYSEFYVVDIDLLLFEVAFGCEPGVLPIDFGLLQDLGRVVVHELEELVHHILLIVLDALCIG